MTQATAIFAGLTLKNEFIMGHVLSTYRGGVGGQRNHIRDISASLCELCCSMEENLSQNMIMVELLICSVDGRCLAGGLMKYFFKLMASEWVKLSPLGLISDIRASWSNIVTSILTTQVFYQLSRNKEVFNVIKEHLKYRKLFSPSPTDLIFALLSSV